MNFGEIKTEVQRNVAHNVDPVTLSLGTFINSRQRQICRMHNFGFMIKTASVKVDNTATVWDLPADFKDDIRFWYMKGGDHIHIEHISYLDGMMKYADADKDEPQKWAYYGANKFVVFPYPDAAPASPYEIKICYYAWLPDLSADTDTNFITDNYPEALIYGATADALARLGRHDMAQQWEARFLMMTRMLIEDDARRIIGHADTLQPATGDEPVPTERWI